MPTVRNGATFMTVTELAERLQVHRNTVIYWIKEGELRAIRGGMSGKSPYIIPIEDAEAVIRRFEEVKV